jgi:DNA helicase-2/ATP-dependent DNA helicase PcrA
VLTLAWRGGIGVVTLSGFIVDKRAESSEARAVVEPEVPAIVAEELSLLRVVSAKLDATRVRTRTPVDDVGTMIELRDALAEAKPEDQGPLLEQMHRLEALSKQRGKGDSPPVDRASPYFGHLRLLEGDRRRDVLIGQRGFVEPGGGVQIVDWRNAPVSRLFYRYDEGDYYEEQLGDRTVEGEVLARRTVTITDGELCRVNCHQGTWAIDRDDGTWRSVETRHSRLSVKRDGSVTELEPAQPAANTPKTEPRNARLGFESDGTRRSDRFLPAIAALIDPRQFDLISRPSSGLIVVQGSAGSGKTTIGLHRIAYLAFAHPHSFRPERMLVIVYQRALATYVSRVLPALEVPGVPVQTFATWAESVHARQVPRSHAPDNRRSSAGTSGLVPGRAFVRVGRSSRGRNRVGGLGRGQRAGGYARDGAGALVERDELVALRPHHHRDGRRSLAIAQP